MSSIENTAHNLDAALAAIPTDELTAAAGHIAQARNIIGGVADIGVQWQMFPLQEATEHGTQAAEYLKIGKAELSAYLAALGVAATDTETATAAVQAAEAPLPIAAEVANTIHTTLDDMRELAKNSRSKNSTIYRYSYNSTTLEALEAMAEKAVTEAAALQPAVVAALADPAQAGAMLDALQALRFENGHNDLDSIRNMMRDVLDTILYAGDSSKLIELASQTSDPALAERIVGLIIDTYAWSKHPAPAITDFVVKQYKTVLNCYALKPLADNADEDFKNFNGRGNTTVALSRAVAEAPVHEAAVLMKYLKAGGDGPFIIFDRATMSRILVDSDGKRVFAGNGTLPDRALQEIYEKTLSYLAQGSHQAEFIQKFGLDADQVFDAWAAGHGGRISTFAGEKKVYSDGIFLRRNMETMLTLEAEEPGICKVLADRLHIRSFARYSPDVLREAYAALSNPPSSYILAAIAKQDHNGAFSKGEVEDIRTQIQQDNPAAVVIPIELDTIEDMWDIAKDLRSRGWGQAEHVLLSGHGTPDSSGLGKDEITIQGGGNTRSSWWALGILARNIVKESGTFTFLSCSTGKGLAQHVSDISGRTTQAPGEDVAVAGIDMVRDASGKLVPSPHYINSKTGKSRPTLTFTPQKNTAPVPPAAAASPTRSPQNPEPGIRVIIPPIKPKTGLLKTLELLNQL